MTLDELGIVISTKEKVKLWVCPECDRAKITEASVEVLHCRNCSDFMLDGWLMEHVADVIAVVKDRGRRVGGP